MGGPPVDSGSTRSTVAPAFGHNLRHVPVIAKTAVRARSRRAHGLTLRLLGAGARRAWCGRRACRPRCAPGWPAGPAQPRRPGRRAGQDGRHIDALARLGFGFIEIGTTTPRAQAGNPRPRLFRLPEHGAIINRLGFNNAGVNALVANVGRSRWRGVLGINIGKNATR